MDENVWKKAMDVMDELEEALRPVGLTVRRLDPGETGDIPTAMVEQEEEGASGVVCNVMPVQVEGMDMTFIQLYLTLTGPAPEDRREMLDRFVKGANERFMLGSLLTFQGGLSMRYTLALDPGAPLDPDHTQTVFAAFLQQAAVFARLGSAVCGGAMTAEAALARRE